MIVKRLLEMKKANNDPVVVTYHEQPKATELYLEEENKKMVENERKEIGEKVKISDELKSDKFKPDKFKSEKIKLDKTKSDKNKLEKLKSEKVKFSDSETDSPNPKRMKREHPRVFISSDSDGESPFKKSSESVKSNEVQKLEPSDPQNSDIPVPDPSPTEKSLTTKNSTTSSTTKVPQKSVPRKGAKKKNSRSGPTLTEIHNSIRKVVNALVANENSWPFREPVTEDIAPQYFDVVKEPMDLKKMGRKNNSRQYKSIGAFVYDFELMISNCIKYNGEDDLITPVGIKLATFFKDKIRQLKLKE